LEYRSDYPAYLPNTNRNANNKTVSGTLNHVTIKMSLTQDSNGQLFVLSFSRGLDFEGSEQSYTGSLVFSTLVDSCIQDECTTQLSFYSTPKGSSGDDSHHKNHIMMGYTMY
jgi:hypothetical protein